MIDPISKIMHRQAGQHGPVMLTYHSVLPGKGTSGWPWAVSMQSFRNQLDFLANEGWTAPTVAELVAAPDAWTGRTVVLTFDDGYADNLAAFEELQKRGMRATLFMITGAIGEEPDWPANGRPAGRLLNAAELRDIQDAGVEIGSHSVNHLRLPGLDDKRLRTETADSRKTLQDILGSEVSSFSYPYGAWDERSVCAVREAGYEAACTTDTGWALRDHDAYRIRRLTIFNSDNSASLARKLSLGSNDAGWRAVARYALKRMVMRGR